MQKLLDIPFLASEHGKKIDDFIIWTHYLMILLFIGWFAYFIYTLVKFRKPKNPKADHEGAKTHASNYIEIAVVVAEGVLLVFLSIPLWAKYVEDYPVGKDTTVMRVTAQQFTWNTRYPGADGVFGKQDIKLLSASNPFGIVAADPAAADDKVAPMREMAAPVNKPVIAHITSMDVIHSFKLVHMRVTQDAIPGLSIPVHFVPTKEGRYAITCAQLCGNGHYSMIGYFNVLSQEKYDEWQAGLQAAGGASAVSFE